jgi:ribosomal protein S12 methylthiotransferase accessory factor YcaO
MGNLERGPANLPGHLFVRRAHQELNQNSYAHGFSGHTDFDFALKLAVTEQIPDRREQVRGKRKQAKNAEEKSSGRYTSTC